MNAPQLKQDYAANFNAVDWKDHDSTDYSTSVRTMWWYLCLLCWILDCVVHVIYVVVCYMYNDGIESNDGRDFCGEMLVGGDFQVALGIALVNYAIELEWSVPTQQKPDLTCQSTLLPFDCEQCYFCVNNMTKGIHHCPEIVTHVQSDRKTVKKSGCNNEHVKVTGNSGASYCQQS